MIQFFYWFVGMFVGVLTIMGVTARVTEKLGEVKTSVALLQLKIDQLETTLEKLERRFEAAAGSR